MVATNRVKNRFSVSKVGESFLAHYRNLGYQEISGSSLLSKALPMTFVMSAGMVQFEQLSQQPRQGNQFVLIQNCFRHFDLDKIGSSDFHLSLFQMPGAFCFGVVDRYQTIRQIWQLLIQEYGFDPDRLFVTYFGGGQIGVQTLPADRETYAAWRSAGVPERQILDMPIANNFWRQSAHMVGIVNSRKCGPTTEVFFDRGSYLSCGATCYPGCPCGRFVEILNSLAITWFLDEETEQIAPLAEPFIETVIGRERVAALLQGVDSVYDIDNILPLTRQVRCFAKPGPLSAIQQRKHEHLLVDHLRALLFLVRDGAPPPGKGGQARLMRILTRELLTSQRLLGISDSGFLRSMLYVAKDLYPDLAPAQAHFMEYLEEEEWRFKDTVEIGLRRFEQEYREKGNQLVTGQDILRYEKQHGIPFSLLEFLFQQKQIPYNHEDYQISVGNFRRQELENQISL
jgi:alanyl-tRNA synthetase